MKNHGSIIACSGIAEVCVTAHKLEKVANTMLRASELAALPVIPAPRRVAILEARKGVESPVMMQERWRMLQDYYLGRGNG